MDNKTILNLLLRAGQMLLESGAETYRAEDAALYMFRQLGEGEINIFAVPTMMIIEIDAPDGTTTSGYKRIRKRSIHLGKIEQINDIVRQVAQGDCSADEALSSLKELDNKKENDIFRKQLADSEGIKLEPSALAGVPGMGWICSGAGNAYAQQRGLDLAKATHIAWATGGSMVPADIWDDYYKKGAAQ